MVCRFSALCAWLQFEQLIAGQAPLSPEQDALLEARALELDIPIGPSHPLTSTLPTPLSLTPLHATLRIRPRLRIHAAQRD